MLNANLRLSHPLFLADLCIFKQKKMVIRLLTKTGRRFRSRLWNSFGRGITRNVIKQNRFTYSGQWCVAGQPGIGVWMLTSPEGVTGLDQTYAGGKPACISLVRNTLVNFWESQGLDVGASEQA